MLGDRLLFCKYKICSESKYSCATSKASKASQPQCVPHCCTPLLQARREVNSRLPTVTYKRRNREELQPGGDETRKLQVIERQTSNQLGAKSSPRSGDQFRWLATSHLVLWYSSGLALSAFVTRLVRFLRIRCSDNVLRDPYEGFDTVHLQADLSDSNGER